MNNRVLLTGGAGFIGSHTVEHLLKNTDWEIVVLDGLSHAGDINRLTDIECYDPLRVTVLWHDLRAPIHRRLDDRIGHIDYVLNIASESHVDRSISDPVTFINSNVQLMLNMMEWARLRFKLKSFIHISTDEVYGSAPPGYSHKEWDSIIPSNPYSASKAAQEAIAISYWRTYELPIIITNTMNNFGERQDVEKFIPKTIKHILAGEPVPIHAAKPRPRPGAQGSNTLWEAGSRVWLHARNHADALLWLLTNTTPTRYGSGGEVPDRYNVAGDKDLKNDDLARHLGTLLGKEANLHYEDYHSSRPGHDLRYSLDGTKLRDLGWIPPMDFEQSLQSVVNWTLQHPEWLK